MAALKCCRNRLIYIPTGMTLYKLRTLPKTVIYTKVKFGQLRRSLTRDLVGDTIS